MMLTNQAKREGLGCWSMSNLKNVEEWVIYVSGRSGKGVLTAKLGIGSEDDKNLVVSESKEW